MSVVKSKKKTWSSVPLPLNQFVTDDNFQFLCQIEELNEYNVVKANPSETPLAHETKPKKKAKRRPDKVENDEIPAKKSVQSHNSLLLEKDSDQEMRMLRNENEDVNQNLESAKQSTSTPITDDDCNQWNAFGLSDEIIKALLDLNFREPTPIQKQCILPAVRDRMDILGAAETGSGKTLAFGIPIVHGILNSGSNPKHTGAAALILTPTRELAIQIKDHIVAVLKYTSIKVACIVGGLSVQKQERLLKKRPEILVATPGRLWSMMQEQQSEYLSSLPAIKYLVIDETDRMVEKGHFQELSLILDRLTTEEDAKDGQFRQTFVFSATLAFVHAPPRRLASKAEVKQMTPKEKIEMIVALTRLREQRKVVDITRNFGTAESLLETKITCDNLEQKDTYLYYFLTKYPGRTLIFANSVDTTRRLKNLLIRLKYAPFVLNAQMHQKQRLKNLEKFCASSNAVLLATDVAARGLDIKNIDHVIHYQVPRTAELYVHRSGRTARANKEGLSVMLIDSQDVLSYKKICQSLNKDKDLAPFPVDYDLVTYLNGRVKLATQIESLEHKLSKQSATKNWFKRAAKEAEFDDEDTKSSSDDEEHNEVDEQKRMIKLRTNRLNLLLNQPLPKRSSFSTRYPTSLPNLREEQDNDEIEDRAIDVARKEAGRPKEKVFVKNLGSKEKRKELKKKFRKVMKKKRR